MDKNDRRREDETMEMMQHGAAWCSNMAIMDRYGLLLRRGPKAGSLPLELEGT
jgi:hypothetical protein